MACLTEARYFTTITKYCPRSTTLESGALSSADSVPIGVGDKFSSLTPRAVDDRSHETDQTFSTSILVGGASAGSLLGAALVAGSPTLQSLWITFSMAARECSNFVLGPFNRKIFMEKYVRAAMEDLPSDAHIKLSNRLFVSLTHATTGKNVIISNWESREDLIQCLLCSCYIPVFSGGPIPKFRGVPYIDGGFSNNQPKPPNDNCTSSCLTISAFASKCHICPHDIVPRRRYLSFTKEKLLISKNNFTRFYRALMPYDITRLEWQYWQGFKDAESFLAKRKRVP